MWKKGQRNNKKHGEIKWIIEDREGDRGMMRGEGGREGGRKEGRKEARKEGCDGTVFI
jgi:hypothetical protein